MTSWGHVGVAVTVSAATWLATSGSRPVTRSASMTGAPDRAARRVSRIIRPAWARRRQLAREDAEAVAEVCALLATELASGRPPGAALRTATDRWPPLAPVADAFTMGSDVPSALRELAVARPGAGDLRLVAAAWQVAHRSGHGLAGALDRVAGGIRRRRRTRRVVESELASARATARLVAVLPVVALAMGSGAGGDPWSFLLTTPAGIGCLVAGLALVGAGLAWVELLADRAAPP